jgi:hypothetical protein
MISTLQNEVQTVTNRRQKKQKPLCEIHLTGGIHYNKHMAGVDKKDQMLQMYLAENENK